MTNSFFTDPFQHLNLQIKQWFAPGWMVTISVLQVIATMVLVSLFFITKDISLVSSCILSVVNLGYAQYDLISIGLLIAGPLFQCILCLEALFQRQAACLYAMLLFEVWLIIYTAIQAYVHPQVIQAAAECQYKNNNNIETSQNGMMMNEPMISYSVVAVTCISFLLLLILAIYHRQSFQQSMDPVHGALAGLLKLDFYLTFAYLVQLLPLPLIHTDVVPVAELVIVFGTACLIFLLAWGLVLVTWQPLPWWRISLHMAGLGLMCLGAITYLCYRLIVFALDPHFVLRYCLIFTSLFLIITLLLTMSVVTTCAARQWQMRHHPPSSSSASLLHPDNQHNKNETKQLNHQDDDDSIHMFLTPQQSRIPID
ncbi:uncharacterized protein BX664DRAFT_11431 [Halteromyces radiatus]|uniref:uncharacterized protein n=1 Tax=Halteromyces radiatus TaxID=101107 RepID=UPI0022212416|nr:uncharacterized protein BX664DRAFT_11431 [Halteromyces radiatus]KAI8099021.1 hypothetical protein BX664DRAFT_11431 [Halteromyces radiatus]